jgi:hypothetical protein
VNAYQIALANFLDALEPVVRAPQDVFLAEALVQAMELAPGTSVAALDVASDVQAIKAFLELSDPQVTDFVDVATHVTGIVTSISNFANAAAVEKGISALAVLWIKRNQPLIYTLFRMAGVIESRLTDHWSEELHLDRIGELISDARRYLSVHLPLQTEADAQETSNTLFKPLAIMAAQLQAELGESTVRPILPYYGWDSPPDPNAPVGEAVASRALSFGFAAEAAPGVEASVLFSLALVPAIHGGPGAMLSFLGTEVAAEFGDGWKLKATLDSQAPLALWWMFGKAIQVRGSAGASLTLEISRTPDAGDKPMTLPLFGGTRFEVGDPSFRFEANGHDVDARITLHKAALVVGAASGDSFTRSATPSSGARAEVDLMLGISGTKGVYFGATAGITATFALNKSIGPLHLDTLTVEVRPAATGGDILTVARLTLAIKVGPVTVSIDGIGMRANVSFPKGGGNLGPLNLKPQFQWPRGAGIVISAPGITGGGYIYFDEEAGRYSGVLQLEMRGIAIKAIGILDTKLPGGGYSFLIIMSGEFSPIQLGLGFTLKGVGGLAGINRTITISALQAGIRNHAADEVLFPKDPVKNAPRIISDLQRFFPPLKSHYIFGPAALIGWGTPTLLTVKLGIILEFPPPLRIVLLGQLDCALPDASTAVVDLHVDILGVIDFGAKFFALDGVIHDSRLGPFALFGDFAVRMRWGNDPTFALAVGGFNPHFQQIPVGFPDLRRITLALGDGDNPRLTLQCYLALTSNSLQLGARAELYAEAEGFNVIGWIGFDALIYFHPFQFRADLSAGFRLRRGSKSLGGIQVDATLTGPSPWHVWGEASISILFFDVSVDFDVTIGGSGPGSLPSSNVWSALLNAIQTGENWSAVLPPAAAQVVTWRQPSDQTPPVLLIDPVGTITLLERTAPLARTITKFADASPSGPSNRFDLNQVKINTNPITGWKLTQELFAPDQFEQLSDDQKLSRPSFERMAAGMALPQLVTLGGFVASEVTFRTVVFDSPAESHDGVKYPMDAALQVALADVGSAATGGMRVSTQPYVAPGTKPPVTLAEETYVVVWAADLTRRLTAAVGPKGAVIAALNEHLAAHPADRANLIVVPEYEAAA